MFGEKKNQIFEKFKFVLKSNVSWKFSGFWKINTKACLSYTRSHVASYYCVNDSATNILSIVCFICFYRSNLVRCESWNVNFLSASFCLLLPHSVEHSCTFPYVQSTKKWSFVCEASPSKFEKNTKN